MSALPPDPPFDRTRHEWRPVPLLGVEAHSRAWDPPTPTDAPPIVLVAGMGMASRYWSPLAWRLSSRFAVMAPDLPGFGRTPRERGSRWPGGPGPRQQADQLRAWLDAHHLQRVTLVGHSTGCQTVADFAARFPDRVHRLVLAGPPFEPGHRRLWEQLPRLAWAAAYEAMTLFPVIGLEYASAGIPRILQQGLRVMKDPMERKLPLIETPTLVIAGRLDPLGKVSWCQAIARALPQGELVVIDRVGHAMQFSAAQATARVILEFLDDRLDLLDRGPQPVYTDSPIARANLQALSGVGLMTLALLNRRRAGAKWLAGMGAMQLATALLSPKPVGPAHRCRVR